LTSVIGDSTVFTSVGLRGIARGGGAEVRLGALDMGERRMGSSSSGPRS
jgi:hypothetical protein